MICSPAPCMLQVWRLVEDSKAGRPLQGPLSTSSARSTPRSPRHVPSAASPAQTVRTEPTSALAGLVIFLVCVFVTQAGSPCWCPLLCLTTKTCQPNLLGQLCELAQLRGWSVARLNQCRAPDLNSPHCTVLMLLNQCRAPGISSPHCTVLMLR